MPRCHINRFQSWIHATLPYQPVSVMGSCPATISTGFSHMGSYHATMATGGSHEQVFWYLSHFLLLILIVNYCVAPQHFHSLPRISTPILYYFEITIQRFVNCVRKFIVFNLLFPTNDKQLKPHTYLFMSSLNFRHTTMSPKKLQTC